LQAGEQKPKERAGKFITACIAALTQGMESSLDPGIDALYDREASKQLICLGSLCEPCRI